MKILFYINSIYRGGAERVMVNLANMFAQKYEVVFVTLKEQPNEYELSGVKRYSLNMRGKKHSLDFLRSAQIISHLREILKNEEPDVIITFIELDSLVMYISKLFLKIPQIVSIIYNPYVGLSQTHKKIIYKSLYSHVDGCIFQTKNAKTFFSLKIQKKSTIINNLIDARLFDIITTDKRKDIICVGRLTSGKSWEIAIKAFSLVSDEVEDQLIIYGEGEERTRLNEYIETLGLTERVILAGITTDTAKAIANAKLFLFSSKHEGLPNALIEALILGTPCVSTKFSGGSAEMLIESGVNGILVSIGDSEAMAKAMLKILGDCDYAALLGQNAKNLAKEMFHPSHVFTQWEKYVLSCVERNK